MDVAPVVAQWDVLPPIEAMYNGVLENPAADVFTSTKMPVPPPWPGCHAVDPGVVLPDPILMTANVHLLCAVDRVWRTEVLTDARLDFRLFTALASGQIDGVNLLR